MRPSRSRQGAAQRRTLGLLAAGATALAALGLRGAPAPAGLAVADADARADGALQAPEWSSVDGAPTDARERTRRASETSPRPEPAAGLQVRVEAPPELRADVPLAVVVLQPDASVRVVAEARSDAQGRASFAPGAHPGPTQVVDLAFPSSGAYAQAIDSASREVTMFLPDLGALRVVVVEADERPATDPVTLHVTVLDAAPPATRPHARHIAGGSGCVLVEASGLACEVGVTTADGRRSAPIRVCGPAQAGEVRECRVVLPAPRLLRARLLAAHGQPLAGARVAVSFADSGAPITADLASDSAGVVAFRAPTSPGRARWSNLVFLAHDPSGQPWLGRLLADLHADGASGLGDVVLAEPALLVSGTCVDSDGRPRPDARLRVQAEGPLALDKRGRRCVQWIDVPAVVVVDADGAFTIRGVVESDQRLRLLSTGDATAQPFRVGDADVRLRVSGRAGWPRAGG